MVTSPGVGMDAIDEVLRRHQRKAVELSNRNMEAYLNEGESYLYPQGKVCDCGTALGSLNHHSEAGRVEKKWLDHLRKKGWGKAKIKRWVEQKKLIEERDERVQRLREEARGPDPDGWCAILAELLENCGLSYVGLFLHWYNGDLESEKFSHPKRVDVDLNDKLAETLFHMEEDMLYVIRKPKINRDR